MTRFCYLFRKLPTDDAKLDGLAQELGISMFNTAVTKNGRTGTDTYEVQRRIRENIKDWRDSLLWLIAVIAATASVFSAVAAWRAVVMHCSQ
ncbi:MAG: hypothetical protein ACRD2L_01000 [Terriglobia bacterium]